MKRSQRAHVISKKCGNSQAKRAERSGLPRFFFGYFLCINDKESNNKIYLKESFRTMKKYHRSFKNYKIITNPMSNDFAVAMLSCSFEP